MKKINLEIPSMYGDHHVLAVREALTKLNGIKEVYASSAWKQLMISFDPKKIKQPEIEKALTNAGYPVGEGEPPVLVETDGVKSDPQWHTLGVRITQTDEAEVDLSGEFRR